MPSLHFALVALYTATFIVSINGVISKSLPLNAVSITHLRCIIAGAALALFTLAWRQSLGLHHRRHYPFALGLGLVMAMHWSFFFHAMQVSTVAIGILAHYSYPVFTVLMESYFQRQWPAISDCVAGLVVLVGVALMVPDWQIGSSALAGVGFGLLSALTFAGRNVLQHRFLQGERSNTVMLYQVWVVALVTAPLCAWADLDELSITSWQLLLMLGLVSTALCHTLIAVSLRVLPAKSVGLISCLQPPLAVLLSWLLLGERPNASVILGGSLILATALFESYRVKR